MSSHPAIRVSGLSKLYRVGARQQGYRTLRESIADAFWAPFRSLSRWERAGVRAAATETLALAPSPSPRLSGDQFWALKDVSFDVQPGEVVGIIGRNGAGKSTLLKILSRITEPTSGRIELRGRVGSLLEVGTGFHPELTGRENIYMNGSILGMSRREIARKFDEIVAFAEVEDFLDTPVKRYSSGMYVRLAFAVAAHLEPEILIVDEVLAVGDAAFQRKCLNRMGEVARHGRTVLFVSHNLAAMESLCTAGVFLDGGRIAHAGDIHDGIRAYRETVQAESEAGQGVRKLNHPLIERVLLIDAEGEPTTTIRLGEPFEFRIDFSAVARLRSPRVILGIDDAVGGRLLTLLTPLNSHAPERIEGPSSLVCRAPAFPLAPGLYSIRLRIVEGNEERLNIERAFLFSVTDAELFDSGHGFWAGVCVANANWAMHKGTEPTT